MLAMIIIKHPIFCSANENSTMQEMAYPADKVEQKLSAFEEVVFDHLLKLFYFRDFSEYFNNWTSSVSQMRRVYKISKGKGKDRFPDAQTILDWVWNNRVDCFEDHHRSTIKDFNYKGNPDYSKLPYIHSGGKPDVAGKFMGDYYYWLAINLSKKGSVTLPEIQDKIRELFHKYPYNGN
jgi:hypothetical protein